MIEIDNNEFVEVVRKSSTIADVLRYFNFRTDQGHYYRIFHAKVGELSIDTSHFLGKKRGSANFNQIPLETILVKNSTYRHRRELKKRLLKSGLLTNKCYICGITDWLDIPLSLQLDHINGINNDNTLTNLRLLCPNCHSQTETFGGKRLKKLYFCISCQKPIKKKSIHCINCVDTSREPKIKWPSAEDIVLQIKQTNFEYTAKKLGVSSNAVRKYLRKHGIMVKPWKKEVVYLDMV
jgi:hypothetical protein